MNSIDERIVGMRFDNAQFEKGVKQSMRTLQELKEASNLDDVAASIGDVSKSIDKNLQFQNPTKSAGIFSKALKGMGKVASKTFNAATFPVQALGRSIQSLGKYTRAVLGIDLASQLVNTGERVVRAFTIDPLKSGWNEYELKMDSIKTIMTGTVKTYTDAMTKKDPQFLYDEEKHLEYVKNGLEELNAYADKTIYSFQDMTSNIGKFTNAGVDFETAVDAIKGISNAAAHAGQGTAQASSAMYNLSQSLGMGYLGMMDWRSIENANMATLSFKQTLIDIGVALGQLKKDEKSGKLYTINEKGMMDTSMEVTAENLRETLSKKWVNKEVLLNALRVYSGEFTDDELRSLQNLSEEEKAALKKIGEEAAKAATQVRTFSKMWDALKEAAQSGWAISWELIFGDMNEATNFWTSLNDRFSGFLDKMSESRNNLLHEWRGQETYWDLDKKMYTWVDNPDAEDGRKILIDSLHEMLDTIGRLGGAIGEAWNSVFGTIDAKKLIDITKRFSAFTKKFSDWLGSSSNKSSRISKLASGLKGIFSLLKGAGNTVKSAITTIAQTLHLDKLLDVGINAFGKAGEWLSSLGASISGIWESIGQSEIMQKLSGFFENLWSSVSKFFLEKNEATGHTGFVDWLDGTIKRLEAIWTEFQKTEFYQHASEIWEKIVGYFKPKARFDKKDSKWIIESDFVANIKSAFNSVKDFFTDVQSWDIWENIGGFFDPIIKTVQDFFAPKTTKEMVKLPKNALRIANASMGDAVFISKYKTEDSPFVAWIKQAFSDLQTFFQKDNILKMFEDAKAGIHAVIDSIVDFFSPRTIPGKMGNAWTEDSPFVSTIKQAFAQIREFFSSENLEDGETMFGHIFSTAKESFLEKWETFKAWITEISAEVSSWFESDTWTGFIGFFTNFEKKEFGESTDENDFISQAKKLLTEKWEAFKTWAVSLYEAIKKWFEEGETWNGISSFFTGIGDTLSSIFGSKENKNESQLDNNVSFFERIMESISGFVEKAKETDIWEGLTSFFNSVGNFFSSVAESIKASKIGVRITTVIKLLFDSLEKILVMVHDFLDFFVDVRVVKDKDGNSGLEEVINAWKVMAASLIAIVASLVSGVGSLMVSTAAGTIKAIARVFTSMSIFIGALTVFGALLSILPGDVRGFVTGGMIIVGILTVAITLMTSIAQILKGVKAESPTVRSVAGSWFGEFAKDLFSDIVKWIGIILLFKEGLPPLLNAMKGLDADAGQILALFGGVTILIAAVSGLSILFSKMQVDVSSAFSGSFAMVTSLMTTLLPLILAMSVIGLAVKNEATSGVMEAVLDAAEWIGTIIRRFNDAIYGADEISNADLVEDLTNLATPIQGLAAVGEVVSISGLLQLEEAMQIIQRLMNIKINDASLLSQWFAGELTIDQTLSHMASVSGALVTFNEKLHDESGKPIDFSNTVTALQAFESVAKVLESLTYIRKNYSNLSNLFEDLLNIMTADDNAGWDESIESFMANFGIALNNGLSEAAKDIDTNPIIDAITKSIRAGSPEIQEAIEAAVLNKPEAEKAAGGVAKAVEDAETAVVTGAKEAFEKTQNAAFEQLKGTGQYLIQNGWFADFDKIFSQVFGPEGAVGALAGGSLANYLIGDNASLLPFNLSSILENFFGVDLGHMLPKDMTLDGMLGILFSGDTEQIGELMSSYFGIDASGIDFSNLKDLTVKDLSTLFSKVEGYEGSAIQSFFKSHDPNATINDMVAEYMPNVDVDSLDWTDPKALMTTFFGEGFGDIGSGLNALFPGGLGSFIDIDSWTKWLNINPEQLDTSTLQSTVQSIIPAIMTAVVNGINEGINDAPSLNISFLDQIWRYLGVNSAEIKITDLQSDVTTVVAQIVPEVVAGISDGIDQGLTGLNLMPPFYNWLGVDQSKIDTTTLKSAIAGIVPSVIEEVESGLRDGLKNKPLLQMAFDTMLQKTASPKMSITPVLDENGLEGNALLALQNGSISLNGAVQIDPLSLGSVVSAINNQGSRISSAISNLGSRIDSVAAAVRSMKIVLNTGTIAGAVDGALGFNNSVYGRTGASSDYHPNGGSVINPNNYIKG